MFDSAKDIMQWLSLCAQIVAKADKPVHWTTPLGLPVVQPYRKQVCPAPASDQRLVLANPPSPAPSLFDVAYLVPVLRSPLPVHVSCVQLQSSAKPMIAVVVSVLLDVGYR